LPRSSTMHWHKRSSSILEETVAARFAFHLSALDKARDTSRGSAELPQRTLASRYTE